MNDEYKRFTVIDRYQEKEYFLLISEDGININSIKDDNGKPLLFKSERAAKLQATKRNLIVINFDEFFEKLQKETDTELDYKYLEVYKTYYQSMYVEYCILEMWDGCFCLGKNTNLRGGYYDNHDNSLKYLTQNTNMLPFLQGAHFNVCQTDLPKVSSYSDDDLEEWARLCDTELDNLEKMYEPTFLGTAFVNYNALLSLSKTSISASLYAKMLKFRTKDYSYENLSEIAAEKGLWNFAATEINRIMDNRIPAVKVLFNEGEYLFMIPSEDVEAFLPQKNLKRLEEYIPPKEIDFEEEIVNSSTEEFTKIKAPSKKAALSKASAFLDRLIVDAKDLVSFGEIHETECVEMYEKYLKKLEFFKVEYEKLGVLDLTDLPKIQDYLPNVTLNWREEKHAKLSNEIERLLSKKMEAQSNE